MIKIKNPAFAGSTFGDRGKDITFKTDNHVSGCIFFPSNQFVFVPFPSNPLKGVGGNSRRLLLFFFPDFSWVNALADKGMAFFTFLACLGKQDSRIVPEGKYYFLLVKIGTHSPNFRAGWCYFKIKSVSINESVRLHIRFCILNLPVIELPSES